MRTSRYDKFVGLQCGELFIHARRGDNFICDCSCKNTVRLPTRKFYILEFPGISPYAERGTPTDCGCGCSEAKKS